MGSWKQSSMTEEQLVDEYVNQRKSLSQICRDHSFNSTTELSAVLRKMGYVIRNKYDESAHKRKITKDNMEERWGISWDELVEWYKARKPLTALCAKHGLRPQIIATLNKFLIDGGVRRKFNLSRHAGTVISSVLREHGVNRFSRYTNTNNKRQFSSDGYVRLPVTPSNKHLTNVKVGGNEMEHRLVVAAYIGRPLKRNEWVHHINRDTTDNRLSNLLLVDKNTHRRIHTSMDKVIEELFEEGIIAVGKDKKYVIRESDEYTRGFTDGMQAILEME